MIARIFCTLILLIVAPLGMLLQSCQYRGAHGLPTLGQSLPLKIHTHQKVYYLRTHFLHEVIVNDVTATQHKDHLTIYIEGDGRAFVNGRITQNPVSSQRLMYKLMQQDHSNAIYLGRPCYFIGHQLVPKSILAKTPNDDARCSPFYWSSARYSREIVNSMISAINRIRRPTQRLTLIGHSGGATLATLIAARLPEADHLITLSGNLNVTAWQQYYGFTPLTQSLDPNLEPPLPARIRQTHLIAGNDKIIKPSWIKNYVKRQPNAHWKILNNVTHSQGWLAYWPTLLDTTR